MAFDFSTLITDRSPEDLQAIRDLLATPMADWTAEQLAQFNQAVSKGAYNYTDLNRVTACMDYLNEVLTGLGYVTGYQKIRIPHQESGGRLPEGYTELEYIQSSGTQYVDTGFKPNQDTRVVCISNLAKQNTAAWLFGARNGGNDSTFGFLTYQNLYRSDYNDSQDQTISETYTGFFCVDKDKNVTKIDGEEKITHAAGTFQTNYLLLLFANNSAGSITGLSSCAMKSCQIYSNDLLVRDFVPCINQNGEVGLYDTENNQFYGNAGTGTFTAGPEIPPEPGEVLDPYTWYESDTPTKAQMTRYLANAEALKGSLILADHAPVLPPDIDGLTTQEANDIEDILLIIQAYLTSMMQVVYQSGMVWAVSGGPGWYFGQ